MNLTNSSSPLNVELARQVGVEQMRRLGFERPDLRLLRSGENMTFDARETPFVLRFTPPYVDISEILYELKCIRYLRSAGFPANRIAPLVEQPIHTAAGLLTVWIRIKGRGGTDADAGLLGKILKDLHNIPRPPWLAT